MAEVMTVLGPVEAGTLGYTLPHEHLFINLVREYRGNGLLNDYALMVQEVNRFKDVGGSTIVDCTNLGLQRDPADLHRVAEQTGLNVVMGCGYYRDPYIDRDWIDSHNASEIADQIIRDIEVGAGDTGVRAGIIGEIGSDKWYISAAEERSFRAAARAQLHTGLTITTHAARWPVGLPQLEVLEAEGVNPRRVIIGHCDMVPSTDYHEALAERGVFVQFDTIRGDTEYDTVTRVNYVLNLVNKGYIDRILLSQDVCLRTLLTISGGCGYDFVLTSFVPLLREAGLRDDQIQQILVDNPARALSGQD